MFCSFLFLALMSVRRLIGLVYRRRSVDFISKHLWQFRTIDWVIDWLVDWLCNTLLQATLWGRSQRKFKPIRDEIEQKKLFLFILALFAFSFIFFIFSQSKCLNVAFQCETVKINQITVESGFYSTFFSL